MIRSIRPTAGACWTPARRTCGQTAGAGRCGRAAELRVPIVGFAAPEGATAVSINVTTTDAVAPGFVTAYPCGGGRPDTSTVNYLAA